ncbi:major tail protein [Pseudoclostridium thermosuccinogenes]|uniref:major tail protein n=1 Tax=Clostridium thermosuccinogenes TaxID=84032 RepID=UPI002FDB418B
MAVKIGLEKAYYAILRNDVEGSVAYDVPVALEKVQQVQVNPRVNRTQVPADNIIDEDIVQCLGADLTIQRKEFTLEEEAILLGRPKDSDGGVYGGTFDNPPYVAFGYKRTFNDGTGLYVWILKTRFAPSNSTADTKPVDSVTPQYDTMSASSITRAADGAWIYSRKSNDPNFASTFFSKATLEKLANIANQTYGQPATVEFVDSLPANGVPGVIYITTDDKAHYWNGTAFVEIE